MNQLRTLERLRREVWQRRSTAERVLIAIAVAVWSVAFGIPWTSMLVLLGFSGAAYAGFERRREVRRLRPLHAASDRSPPAAPEEAPPDPDRHDPGLYGALYESGDWYTLVALWSIERLEELAPRSAWEPERAHGVEHGLLRSV